MNLKNSLAILIPLYKSENNIEEVLDYLERLQKLLQINLHIRFIIDGREEDLKQLTKSLEKWVFAGEYDIVELSKNFGVGPALLAGMEGIEQELITAFGADLQEPVELFQEMLSEMKSGEIDVCLGVRNSREDPFIHSLGAGLFWRINKYILGKEVPSGGFDVFMINNLVKDRMLELKELNTNFTSQMFWIGFVRKFIRFKRVERKIGKSSWTIRRKTKLFFDSIFSFSDIPIRIILYLSIVMIFFSVAVLLLNTYSKITENFEVPGYYTIASLIVLGNGINFFFLSIIGSYVYRTLQNSTGRPPYIIKRLITKTQIKQL